MPNETRACQNCKTQFVIEPEDFQFYEKMKVPPPTWCPNCRFFRRLSWRNMWHLFKKKDGHTGEKIFSIFPEESPVKIYEKDYWNSDAWDPMDHGRDYDWERPFFEQFKELMRVVPFPAHSILNLVNCRYCTNANGLKNCYFVRAAIDTEDSAYLIWDNASKRSMDSFMTVRCELGYGNMNVSNSFKTRFCVDCEDCNEVVLSKDCVGCNNCFGCIGLRNKSYHFFNERCTKEEYAKKLAAVNLGSDKAFQQTRAKAYAFWKTFPHKYIHGRQNVDVTGDYIYESKNAKQCFIVRESEDVKFCQNVLSGPFRDSYDYTNWGQNAELMYECLICGEGNSRLRFSVQCYPNNKDLEYCVFCQKSSDCFGCIGLKNKQYCILNRQYTKEQYKELTQRIRKQMDEKPYISQDTNGAPQFVYRYGEFFPTEFSPFPYHITEAYEYFPIQEREAKERGLVWYPLARDEHEITLVTRELNDHIRDVQDSILNQVIGCAHTGRCAHACTRAFRIIKDELVFCKEFNIPLPRLCPNCRHYERLAFRNLPQLHKRECQCAGISSDIEREVHDMKYTNTTNHFHGKDPCPNEFETSYAPDRPETVYCEQCYNSEVV